MSAEMDLVRKIQVAPMLNKCNRDPRLVKLALILVIEILHLRFYWCINLVGRLEKTFVMCLLYMHPAQLLWYGWDTKKRKRWISIT